MSRNIWCKRRLSVGQEITFQNEKYRVVAQRLQAEDSYHFKAHYYTTISLVGTKIA